MTDISSIGERRFGRVNRVGLVTLIEREMRRFLNVWMQTVLAPLVTAGLFLAIFSLAIGPTRGDVLGHPFLHFIAPGILTMTVIQKDDLIPDVGDGIRVGCSGQSGSVLEMVLDFIQCFTVQ